MKRLQLSACYLPSRNAPGLLRSASVKLAGGSDELQRWLRVLAVQSRVTRMTSSSDVTPACTQR